MDLGHDVRGQIVDKALALDGVEREREHGRVGRSLWQHFPCQQDLGICNLAVLDVRVQPGHVLDHQLAQRDHDGSSIVQEERVKDGRLQGGQQNVHPERKTGICVLSLLELGQAHGLVAQRFDRVG